MKIREGKIERTRKMITFDGKIRKNRKNPNDPARFIEEIHVTDSREVADDEDRIQIKTCICIDREGNQGTLPDMFHCPSCIQNS